jgi:quercetin dioxygenase-like cupin family protein
VTHLKHYAALLIFACSTLEGAEPPAPDVAALLAKQLADIPGKEVLMLSVEYPPGGADPVHRHDAHAFVYVLEGSIVMQVKGAAEVTLTPGQTFYEAPHDVHTIGRNASTTQPAKFIVLLVKDTGVAPVLPAQ